MPKIYFWYVFIWYDCNGFLPTPKIMIHVRWEQIFLHNLFWQNPGWNIPQSAPWKQSQNTKGCNENCCPSDPLVPHKQWSPRLSAKTCWQILSNFCEVWPDDSLEHQIWGAARKEQHLEIHTAKAQHLHVCQECSLRSLPDQHQWRQEQVQYFVDIASIVDKLP